MVLGRRPFPPSAPLLAGRVLPRTAATCRLLCGGPGAATRVALLCLALVPSSYALPTLPRVGWVVRVLTPGLVLPAVVLVPLLAVLLPGVLLPAPVLVFLGGFPPVPRPPTVSIPILFFVPPARRFEEGGSTRFQASGNLSSRSEARVPRRINPRSGRGCPRAKPPASRCRSLVLRSQVTSGYPLLGGATRSQPREPRKRNSRGCPLGVAGPVLSRAPLPCES